MQGLRSARRLGLGPARTRRLCRLPRRPTHCASRKPRRPTASRRCARTRIRAPAIKRPPALRALARRAADQARRDRRFPSSTAEPPGISGRATAGARGTASSRISSRSPSGFCNAPYLWGGRTSGGDRLLRPLAQACADGGGRSPRRATATCWKNPWEGRIRSKAPLAARRSRVLERPCRRHARR